MTIVGIGASAGGLEACTKLVRALPTTSGFVFILVQHLDPAHESMLAELLSEHTTMPVLQAEEGARLEPDHFYVIPPGRDLAVERGTLRLSNMPARPTVRLPFDHLLISMAKACGDAAICVVLSGTGHDGSVGVRAVHEAGGWVIAQEPAEAGFDGMPRSAIATGLVHLTAPVAEIAAALTARATERQAVPPGQEPAPGPAKDRFGEIIELLRARNEHDFSLYRRGTLQRRIERRMEIAGMVAGDMSPYLEKLRGNPEELGRLTSDLLINVTSFFRDPAVFQTLAEQVVPEIVRQHSEPGGRDHTVRIWIAGCSTGEETYSLAMLFLEQIEAARSGATLQVFASDVDRDAVSAARAGIYPASIAAEVSEARLARFFSREDDGYRVLPALRGVVVFTVQNVLADPPFSKLDLVSCRNLLIYLRPEAQKKVVSLFDFALRQGGVLILGSAETIPADNSCFAVIGKAERIYRHVRRGRPAEHAQVLRETDFARKAAVPVLGEPTTRQVALADLVRRLVLDSYAPAAVLINAAQECLYLLGPTDRYLRVPGGQPTQGLLAMVRPSLRTRVRSAIKEAVASRKRTVVPGGRINVDGHSKTFGIDVQLVRHGGEELMLVSFVDSLPLGAVNANRAAPRVLPRIAELEKELETARIELEEAIRELEITSEEQKAVNEEALSVNEEYQSTNEELLTSKEELQSLNEELTALNSQLQETLERQRTTSDDLQNVLYSTDMATLFLDAQLNIRFFTPATRALFNVIPGDVGRPMSDLTALAADAALLTDMRAVLDGGPAVEREIAGPKGEWFTCRVLPYVTHGKFTEGVVITFTDITERRSAAKALIGAREQAEAANDAKTRFLSAASHDLRQPLQTLALLQGLLARAVDGDRAKQLVDRLDQTVEAMSMMLNTLLDINQIEAGVIKPEMRAFPIDPMLARLGREFAYQAQAQGLGMRVVASGLQVRSDPRLLEQMIRNLLANAFKYTSSGRVLLGCRRRPDGVSVQIWDTGMGIPSEQLEAIFEEYHQVGNEARERSHGLGLGLSIVRSLAVTMGHRVRVESNPGHGSMFAIEIPEGPAVGPAGNESVAAFVVTAEPTGRALPAAAGASVLLVEDDPELRELLHLFLAEEGYVVSTAPDGAAALEMTGSAAPPDLVLADYNLPRGVNGVELIGRLRARFGGTATALPAIILTGDTSTGTLALASQNDCTALSKPVRLTQLAEVIRSLLSRHPQAADSGLAPQAAHSGLAPQAADSGLSPQAAHSGPAPQAADSGLAPHAASVHVIDDDPSIRAALASVLAEDGHGVQLHESAEAFLRDYRQAPDCCLLIDAYMAGLGGLDLLRALRARGDETPAILITGKSDVSIAVEAMKAGAADFVAKPVRAAELRACIARALEQSRDSGKLTAFRRDAAALIASLTERQRQIMEQVLDGQPSKNIAADLGVSQRTVENHRAAVMRRTGAKSLPELARLALAAAWNGNAK